MLTYLEFYHGIIITINNIIIIKCITGGNINVKNN